MAILEVHDVNKRFGGLQALNNVNLSIEKQTVHAIIGPNGAGKSTLLNCFVGRLTPDTGTVMFDGQSLLGIQPHEINQTGVARVFQTPEIFSDLTLVENIMIPAFAKRDGSFALKAWSRTDAATDIREKAEHMLEDVGLIEQRDIAAGSLSRGDKRRLELAMCLVQEPKLLLLDETSRPPACPAPTPTTPSTCSKKSASAALPRSSSSTTCMSSSRLPARSACWPKAR